jgi:hypothetical protein
MNITIANLSTQVSEKGFHAAVAAIQRQATEHFAPEWGTGAKLKAVRIELDGRTVYFVTPSGNRRGYALDSESTSWIPGPGGIYFVPTDAHDSLEYFDLTTRKVKQIATLDNDFGPGLSLFPDRKRVVVSKPDDTTNDIMLVDHFH